MQKLLVGAGLGGNAANPAPTNSKHYESLVILSEARNLINVYRTVVKKKLACNKIENITCST
jgi:hypothetical protein